MGTRVKAPKPRNYGQETRDTLQAQVDLAPELYAAEAEFRPKYSQLDVDIAKSTTPQLLDLYETTQDRLGAMDRRNLAAQREGDIEAIERLGGRARAALDAANPEQAALLAELNRQAQEDLAAGGDLSAFERREIQQSARAGQAARGLGYGLGDAAIESLAQLQGASARRREGFAQSMVGINQATGADPFMAILGRPSSMSPTMAGGVVGQAQGFNAGQMFSPESAYAQNIYAGNQQQQLAARTATASNRSAMFGGVMKGIGSIGASMFAGCWVAREVFGVANPKWIEFFYWKEVQGPKWFKNLYNRYGEWFARFISDKPKLKNIVKRWMEDRLNG